MRELERIIEASAAESGFSGIVCVSDGSGSRLCKAYGWRNRAERLAIEPGTRFGIASGTKAFTALAIGRLVERGRLALDDKAAAIGEGFSSWMPAEATVAQLLCHASGCYDYLDEDTMEDYDAFRLPMPWYDLDGPEDYLPAFEGGTPKFSPGERFSYSNGGYVALAAIVERVSGLPYRDFVRQEVLAPAGMVDSGFFSFDELPTNTALGYTGEGFATNLYRMPKRGGGDGGMYATALDLEAFWRALFEGRIISKNLLDDWLAPRMTISERSGYAYGFYRRTKDGSYYLVGGDHGVGFDTRYLPDRNLTLSILSNQSDGEEDLRSALIEYLDGDA